MKLPAAQVDRRFPPPPPFPTSRAPLFRDVKEGSSLLKAGAGPQERVAAEYLPEMVSQLYGGALMVAQDHLSIIHVSYKMP